jgi:hypothetical protein
MATAGECVQCGFCDSPTAAAATPARAAPAPFPIYMCAMKLSAWQLLRAVYASTLGTHRHSIIIHQRTRECLSQQNCIAAVAHVPRALSLQNENATQASQRQEHTPSCGAPFCLHRTAPCTGLLSAAASYYRLFSHLRATAAAQLSLHRLYC